MHTLIFLCFRLENIHMIMTWVLYRVSLVLCHSAQQHYHIESPHPLGCIMTAAKAQNHDSGDTQYELKMSKMWYIIRLRNDGNDPSILPF